MPDHVEVQESERDRANAWKAAYLRVAEQRNEAQAERDQALAALRNLAGYVRDLAHHQDWNVYPGLLIEAEEVLDAHPLEQP